ncbi:hypothetical protein A3731_39215 [Roseovarius sp. HI0049]|nr:hypothetical protein A3731_39215 [Roseovarius sp. HI0049]
MANAGVGLGEDFLEQDFSEIRSVIDLNVTGITLLLHKAGRLLNRPGRGRILVTGSIAGFMPGSYQAMTHSFRASAQAASTASSPSIGIILRIWTICRSPFGTLPSLRCTRLIADGRSQSLKGAPLRRAPGLRARTGM